MFRSRLLPTLLIILGLVAAFGLGFGWSEARYLTVAPPTNIASASSGQPQSVDFAPFWRAWQILDQKFAGDSKRPATDQDRVWGAVSGLVHSLGDPYTEFLPPEDNQIFSQDIQGSFGGIGVEIGVQKGQLMVITPIEGSPAKAAGILAGDQIVEIEGEPVGKMTVTEATNRIRGQVGTTVEISVRREGETELRQLKIKRDVIKVPTIKTELLPQKIFLIQLYNFGATSPDLFRSAIQEFAKSKSDKLILDLRGNPGGFLDASVDIASWFLPQGVTVVSEDRGEGQKHEYTSVGHALLPLNKLKMVVLVDGGSASAAEILAGALREHGVAKLVGQQTFGKGSVQELVPLTNDTSIKVTVAHWFTPKGVSISDGGLKPDVVVDLPEKKVDEESDTDTSDHTLDLILQQGIKLLK